MSAVSRKTAHQLTPRDLICLTWIALQYAIRLDQLQRLLFRYTPEQDRYKLKHSADQLSLDCMYELIAKWLSLGYIEKGAFCTAINSGSGYPARACGSASCKFWT